MIDKKYFDLIDMYYQSKKHRTVTSNRSKAVWICKSKNVEWVREKEIEKIRKKGEKEREVWYVPSSFNLYSNRIVNHYKRWNFKKSWAL